MGEVLFVLQDESRHKSFQHSIQGTFLPFPSPPLGFFYGPSHPPFTGGKTGLETGTQEANKDFGHKAQSP